MLTNFAFMYVRICYCSFWILLVDDSLLVHQILGEIRMAVIQFLDVTYLQTLAQATSAHINPFATTMSLTIWSALPPHRSTFVSNTCDINKIKCHVLWHEMPIGSISNCKIQNGRSINNDGLMRDCSDSSALAMELLQYCTEQSKHIVLFHTLLNARSTHYQISMEKRTL